jgi:hypothetical protein
VTALTSFSLLNAGVIPSKDKLTEDEKIALLRDLSGEYAKTKEILPRSKKPLELNADGTFNQIQWQNAKAGSEPAARVGDKIQITHLAFEGDHLVLEINNGISDGRHWYDHVQVGMGTTTQPVNNGSLTPRLGTYIQINFHKPMEGLTAAEVKKILVPLLIFDSHSATVNYMETLPPETKQAITEKRALVGMDREQVILALGRPERKFRETNKEGVDTEDWIYGTPPGKITFVTFAGNKVIKVKDQYAGLGIETSPK